MDLPISLAVILLYVHGVYVTFTAGDGYLDSLAMLVTLLLAGRAVEARGRKDGAAAAASLAASLPSRARRATPNGVEEVGAHELAAGDLVEVGLGDEVPADGVVVRGSGRVGLALLTGESEPVSVSPGDEVVAGAPVTAGSFAVQVERAGDATLGRRMAREVLAAVDRGVSPTPADRLAPWFTAATLVAATAAFVGWSLARGTPTGVEVAAAVLVVACPCALGLSWPIAVAVGISALARRGVLVRSGDVLLRLTDIDVVALDKTGTVTGGTPAVVAADDDVLRIAAGLERASSHPVAAAIRAEAARRGLAAPVPSDVIEIPGVGVSGTIDDGRWTVRAGLVGEVVLDGPGLTGVIHLRDVRRPDAARVVRELAERCRVALLTGDSAEVGDRVAAEIGAHEVVARATPEAKAVWVRQREAEGRHVLFVGDGLNDGPALVAAHVGFAMRRGAPSSILAADGVVTDDRLAPLLASLRVARVVRSTVRANIVRSVFYNVTAVGAAAAGWIDPLIAALLMPASSLLVLWGGLRVERRVRKEERWT
jgi:heavy metal translocating P-type ATPase